MHDDLVQRQEGMLTRQQALSSGLTRAQLATRVNNGRWQRVLPRVYATFSGALPRSSRLWAVALWAGQGAMLSHQTAAELAGLVDAPCAGVHVTIPLSRRLRRVSGVVVHHSSRAERAAHPSRVPPQTRIEETVLDLVQTAETLDEAMAWVTRACGRRLTTPGRIAAVLADRPRVRWRAPLVDALGGVSLGCHSVLELRYLRDVERAHRLPGAQRQVIRARRGGRWYDDVHYAPYRTRVELDGRVAHPEAERWRDMRRDNAAVVQGDAVLRYGWTDVVDRPCATAGEVATVLARRGWAAKPARCGVRCMIR